MTALRPPSRNRLYAIAALTVLTAAALVRPTCLGVIALAGVFGLN